MNPTKSAEQGRRDRILAITRASKKCMLGSEQNIKDALDRQEKQPAKSGLKLLAQYSFCSKTGKKITITKLSRSFVSYEESQLHRNHNCGFISECVDYAGKLHISCFSCLNCGQKNDRSAL